MPLTKKTMDNEEEAKQNLEKWFSIFKEKLVDDYPEYRITFDYLISDANDKNLLYYVFKIAFLKLTIIGERKGGMNNLFVRDYLDSLEFSYNCFIK